MAILEIPIRGDLLTQNLIVPLEGVQYKLKVYYGVRDDSWFLDLKTRDNVEVITGLILLRGARLSQRFRRLKAPPGEFILFDTTEQDDNNPSKDDFGTGRRFRLRYETYS